MQIVDARIKVYVRFNRNIMGCKYEQFDRMSQDAEDLIGT